MTPAIDTPIDVERSRRDALWKTLRHRIDPNAVPPKFLSEIGVRPHHTVQGIYRDKDQTEALAPPNGVTVSVLYTEQTYEDSFDDEGGLYHYPSTNRAGRDNAEIEATKNAQRLRLPVFVVMRGNAANLRQVRLGWITDWDDDSRVFLLSFNSEPLDHQSDSSEFVLKAERRPPRFVVGTPRPGQARFRFGVFKRYGPQCAVCQVAIPTLLEAVHLCGVADGGGDDPRNGLVLCRNHHRALDEKLFSFEPASGRLTYRQMGPSALELAIIVESLDHLSAVPHSAALAWCNSSFVRASEGRR